jgi:hypothetical protein
MDQHEEQETAEAGNLRASWLRKIEYTRVGSHERRGQNPTRPHEPAVASASVQHLIVFTLFLFEPEGTGGPDL